MSLLGKVLFNPAALFRRTLARVDQIGPALSAQAANGIGLLGSALLEDLLASKVLDARTHRLLQGELQAWHRKRSGAPR